MIEQRTPGCEPIDSRRLRVKRSHAWHVLALVAALVLAATGCTDDVPCRGGACTDPGACVYGGQRYRPGQSFPSTDGCNTCTCSEGGRVACTLRACVPNSCGGLAGTSCRRGQYCSYPPSAQCGAADQTGSCETIPDACDDLYSPVCGCDDKTYSNACEAAAQGVSVASQGECKREDPCADIPKCRLLCPDGTIHPTDDSGCVHTCDCVVAEDPYCAGKSCGDSCAAPFGSPLPTYCDAEGKCRPLPEPPACGGLSWYLTCGGPVCRAEDDPFDSPDIPNCTTQAAGDPCKVADDRCDGVASCGAFLVCTDQDPRSGPCPISRARYKQDIRYLTESERAALHDQVVQMPLASYHYRTAPGGAPELGFIIEDVEPSAAVRGDRVNLYGYLSMAVAAIQEQQTQIQNLERELKLLRSHVDSPEAASMCSE